MDGQVGLRATQSGWHPWEVNSAHGKANCRGLVPGSSQVGGHPSSGSNETLNPARVEGCKCKRELGRGLAVFELHPTHGFGAREIPIVAVQPAAVDHPLLRAVRRFDVRHFREPAIETQFGLQ